MLFWRYEAKLPAEEDQARPHSRVPCPFEDQDRPSCNTAPYAQGPHPPGRLMPAKYTLSRTDFTRMRGFKRLHGSLFSLSYGSLSGRMHPGAACVVSAKVAPKAVTRNVIKRRVRAALTPLLPLWKPSSVVVFHARKPAATADQKEIREEIQGMLAKTGVFGGK